MICLYNEYDEPTDHSRTISTYSQNASPKTIKRSIGTIGSIPTRMQPLGLTKPVGADKDFLSIHATILSTRS